MTAELINIVKQIHDDYSPFNDMEGRFLGRNQDEKLGEVVNAYGEKLPDQQSNRLQQEFFGWGPIAHLLEDDSLNEIVINGPQHLYTETRGHFKKIDDHFLSELTFRNFVQRLCQESHCQISVERPHANGVFKKFRLHITMPPISETVLITLRRHLNQALELDDYLEKGVMTDEQHGYLCQLIEKRNNFLIVGNTGSGKTTLLNSLLQLIQDQQRVLVIEDTPEICLPNSLSIRLKTREALADSLPPIGQQELVRQALRMRPDRIIMGEVRSEEAKDLLQALATGHSGSIATIHANSPKQALYRLEMLVQMGAPQWQIQAIRRLIQLSLDHLVLIKNVEGQRQIEGIYQLASLEDFGFLLNKMC